MAKKKRSLKPYEYENMEYLEYADKLNDEERAYIQQFYEEFYADLVSEIPEEDRILKGEMLIEGHRQYNRYKRDLFDVSKKKRILEYAEEDNKFMEDACDEWEWRDALKIGGYELATKVIICQTMNELRSQADSWSENWPTTLSRMYVKMNELRKEYNKEQRKKNEK